MQQRFWLSAQREIKLLVGEGVGIWVKEERASEGEALTAGLASTLQGGVSKRCTVR